jgi:hypothetical protein
MECVFSIRSYASLFPTFLTQALFALSGVFVLLEMTVFHYFNQDVRRQANDRVIVLLSRESTKSLTDMIDKQQVPESVVRDFTDEVLLIGEPKRVFRATLLLVPIAACLLLSSALLGSLSETAGGSASGIAQIADWAAYILLIFGIGFTVWCAVNIARLARALS